MSAADKHSQSALTIDCWLICVICWLMTFDYYLSFQGYRQRADMYICIHTRFCAICIRIHWCEDIYIDMQIYVYIHIYMYWHTYRCIDTFICIDMCIYTLTYLHILTYIYIYISTCKTHTYHEGFATNINRYLCM